jgi:hypothetical protein
MGKKLIWKLVKWKKKKPYGTKLALTDVACDFGCMTSCMFGKGQLVTAV